MRTIWIIVISGISFGMFVYQYLCVCEKASDIKWVGPYSLWYFIYSINLHSHIEVPLYQNYLIEVCLFVLLFVYMFMCLLVYMFVCLLVYIFLYLLAHMMMFMYLFHHYCGLYVVIIVNTLNVTDTYLLETY